MKTIANVQPVSAEKLFDLLKKEFPDYINSKLDSNLAIDFAHVYDVINVLFLYLAKKIIDAANGHITVESEIGKGSTFSICLPVPVMVAD